MTNILALNNEGEQRGNAACAYHCTQNGNCICIITGGTVSLFFFNLHLQPLSLDSCNSAKRAHHIAEQTHT